MKFQQRTLAALFCAAVLLAPQIAGAVCGASLAADAPNERYSVSGDIVTDLATGLMWKKCSEGQSGSACSGTPQALSWQAALQQVQAANAANSAGYNDWRLPNRNELASLLERKCANPAINDIAFPATPAQTYWSSSPDARNAGSAWIVDFNAGDIFTLSKSSIRLVRLVRAGKQ